MGRICLPFRLTIYPVILSSNNTRVFIEALNFCSNASISPVIGAFISSSFKGIDRNNTQGFLSLETFIALKKD
jgi:hypothetical protein